MSKFSFDPHTQVIVVKAFLQGPKRTHAVSLILDTGATFTMISPEILDDIGIDPSQSHKRNQITTASGIEFVHFVRVPSLKTLGVQRENVEVCIHSLPHNIPARGLLGLNFLRHFQINFNFPNGSLEIIDPL